MAETTPEVQARLEIPYKNGVFIPVAVWRSPKLSLNDRSLYTQLLFLCNEKKEVFINVNVLRRSLRFGVLEIREALKDLQDINLIHVSVSSKTSEELLIQLCEVSQ